MCTILNFMEKATSGTIITENDFFMKYLIPNVRETVKEFNISYEPGDPLCSDDAMADRLFEAAIEFLSRTGVYCDATNRVVHISRKEIIEELSIFSGGVAFGEGKDRRFLTIRAPEDGRLPWLHVGTGIVASSEEIAMAQVEGYGSIRQANSISIPAFKHIKGLSVISGSPLEIHAAVSSVQVGRKALMRCGRPGLPIMNLISSATTSMGTIAASHPCFGLRPSDGWLIDIIAELKVDSETLNRLAFVQLIGGNVGCAALPILGGYAGGPEGTALIMAAYYLLGILFFRASYHLTCPIHFRYGCNTTRDCLWVFSVVGRAMSRNTRYPAISLGYAAAGACTRMYLYEAAAEKICCVLSGYAGVQTTHPGRAVIEDGVTPMEALFNVEVTSAATGMKIELAKEVVNRLLEKYEKEIEKAPRGKRYQECYNIKTGKPAGEYIGLVEQVKEELVYWN